MKHYIFICHASDDKDIVENFAGQLRGLGVHAWVYSIDKTLAKDAWVEIEEKIADCDMFMFVVSKSTKAAKGQHRELSMALKKIGTVANTMPFFPALLQGVDFGDLPEELGKINGVRMDAYTVESTAQEIVRAFFPELLASYTGQEWIYPRPGQWLQVRLIDDYWTEKYFALGALVYFRRISPLVFFECYSPDLGGLFGSHQKICARQRLSMKMAT